MCVRNLQIFESADTCCLCRGQTCRQGRGHDKCVYSVAATERVSYACRGCAVKVSSNSNLIITCTTIDEKLYACVSSSNVQRVITSTTSYCKVGNVDARDIRRAAASRERAAGASFFYGGSFTNPNADAGSLPLRRGRQQRLCYALLSSRRVGWVLAARRQQIMVCNNTIR